MLKLIEGSCASFFPREVDAMFRNRAETFPVRYRWRDSRPLLVAATKALPSLQIACTAGRRSIRWREVASANMRAVKKLLRAEG